LTHLLVSRWSDWLNISEVPGYEAWVKGREAFFAGSTPVFRKYWQENPSIALDSKNNIYIVWEGEDSHFKAAQIKFSKSSDGGRTWSQWRNLSAVPAETTSLTNYKQYRPMILVDDTDTIFVIWDGEDPGHTYSSGKPYSSIKYCYSTDQGETWIPSSIYGGYGGIITSGIDSSKAQKYVSGCFDRITGRIHIVWSGKEDSGGPNTDHIRHAYYDGSWHVTGFIALTTSATSANDWYQKHPSIMVDADTNLHVLWQGNDDDHPYYDEGDPDTKDSSTGFYLMYSKFSNSQWSPYSILDRGLYPHFLKSPSGEYLSWIYTRPEGTDDFKLIYNANTNILLNKIWKEPAVDFKKNSFYICPNPLRIDKSQNMIILYELNSRAKVEIAVYDIEGKKIAVLLNGVREKGRHKFFWDGSTGQFSAHDEEYIETTEDKIKPGVYILFMKYSERVLKRKLFIQQ